MRTERLEAEQQHRCPIWPELYGHFAARNSGLQNRLDVSSMLSGAALDTIHKLEALLKESQDTLADFYSATAEDLARRAMEALCDFRNDVYGPDRKN